MHRRYEHEDNSAEGKPMKQLCKHPYFDMEARTVVICILAITVFDLLTYEIISQYYNTKNWQWIVSLIWYSPFLADFCPDTVLKSEVVTQNYQYTWHFISNLKVQPKSEVHSALLREVHFATVELLGALRGALLFIKSYGTYSL